MPKYIDFPQVFSVAAKPPFNRDFFIENALVFPHLRDVVMAANKLKSRLPKTVDVDDLIQEGRIGLLEAARAYDEDRDIPFGAFAKKRIRGQMIEHLREMNYDVHLPRGVIRERKAIIKLQDKFREADLPTPTNQQISEETGISIDRVICAKGFIDGVVVSMDASNNQNGDVGGLLCTIANEGEEDPFVRVARADFLDVIGQLPVKEGQAARMRFGFHSRGEHTFKDIGDRLGMTESGACQATQRALAKLKFPLSAAVNASGGTQDVDVPVPSAA